MASPSTSAIAASTDRSPLDGLRVVGGRQRAPQGMRELDQRWYGYGAGVVVELEAGSVRTVLEYASAPGTCGPDDPVLFKSATLNGDRLYATTQTEVVVLDWPELRQVGHVSHPMLNDVHHVLPTAEGTLLVAVSGHDAVAELSLDGDLVALWSIDPDRPEVAIEPGRDYRHGCDLKPHAIHPNYLFRLPGDRACAGAGDGDGRAGEAGGELWVTRFEARDAVAVHRPERRIAIDRERCHDGVVHDGRVFFTTVDGHVVEVDASTLQVRAEHRLAGRRDDTLLGWCRGLLFVGDHHAAVGFSRIRHTRFRQTLSWVRNGLTASEPTRVALYDTRTWALVDERDLEGAGCNAVFSILPGPAS